MAPPTHLAASLRDRLKHDARTRGKDLQPHLEDFALGRFFARLSASTHRDHLILKGAQLFRVWSDQAHRPTRDADFLGVADADTATVSKIFDEITATPTNEDDGLKFEPATAEPIRDENAYGGIRLRVMATLGKMRIPLQFDVGFGDAITPTTEERTWPGLLGYPDTRLVTYPVETAIAEKLEAMVSLDLSNSRMKDFYDLHWLATHLDLDRKTVREAIENTFARRQTNLPAAPPVAYTPAFHEAAAKVAQWNAFLRKNRLQAPALPDVIAVIRAQFPFPL